MRLQLARADDLREPRRATAEASVKRDEAASEHPRERDVLGIVRLRPAQLARERGRFFVETPWGASLDLRSQQPIQRDLRLVDAEAPAPYQLTERRCRLGPEKCGRDRRVPRELLQPTRHQRGIDHGRRVEDYQVKLMGGALIAEDRDDLPAVG